MAIGDENNDFIYEDDEKGQRQLVRSIESNLRAYVRFTNKTNRTVDVWWRNYRGERKHYARIQPNRFSNVSTFITHPWEFTDAATSERYVIQNKPIYRPPPNIGGMQYITNWNITVSVRSLRQTALLAVALNIRNVSDVNDLQIPRILIEELRSLVGVLNSPLNT